MEEDQTADADIEESHLIQLSKFLFQKMLRSLRPLLQRKSFQRQIAKNNSNVISSLENTDVCKSWLSTEKQVVIYHNPDCETSRNVLNVIKTAGYEPIVIEYLKVGWTLPQLVSLFTAAGITPRSALRTTKSPAKELGLLDPNVSDQKLIEAMLKYPVLVNRPIVCTHKGVKLCRPSEKVLSLLDNHPTVPVYKESGDRII